MNTALRVLNGSEVSQVSGGHSPQLQRLTVLGCVWFALELPHIAMGIVEFINWGIDVTSGNPPEPDGDFGGHGHHHGHTHDFVGDYIRGYFTK